MVIHSVSEPHHFYEAPAPVLAPGKSFDAAPTPTLLFSKAKFLKEHMLKLQYLVHMILYNLYCCKYELNGL
jgi:hypothetical protein